MLPFCSPEEQELILSWCGYEHIDATGKVYQRINGALGKPIHMLIRRLNHVKLVCNGDQPVKAKAYLYMGYE